MSFFSKSFFFAFIAIFNFYLSATAQNTTLLYGKVADEKGQPLEFVNVTITGGGGGQTGTVTDKNGYYEINAPPERKITIAFSFVGYEIGKKTLYIENQKRYKLNTALKKTDIELPEIFIEDQQIRNKVSMQRIDPKVIETLPSASGGIEAILKTLGASSNNELSSQYSVRGGNYDENLIYVNDFEVYRPFLIRSGQQEGLSFINSDLISSILFSSGGFEAKYGDKMSSVLDVKYKKPGKFRGSVSGSLLNSSMHLEGSTKNHRFTYLLGARYKSNQYLLNSLETKGLYKPSFIDVQSYFTYDITPELELGILGYYSKNKFQMQPDSLITKFGNVKEVVELMMFFEGQEVDEYETAMGGITLNYRYNKNLTLKLLGSVFTTSETEAFDRIGDYFLYAVESDFGKSNFGQRAFALGSGTFHDWARNYLDALVANTEHKGYYYKGDHYIQWGLKYQHEVIDDRINEWIRLDSAGYSIPYSDSLTILNSVIKSNINIQSNRYSAYIQDDWNIGNSNDIMLIGGVRFHYWDFNNEFIISPRVQFSYKPKWKHDIVLKAASGYYYQPPFYREFRDQFGNINKNIQSQRAIHFVLGSDWNFEAWGRPFKFVSEAYYKHLNNLIPYDINNVLIRYHAKNNARGYVMGIDFRIHGEFVEDAESWASLSIMTTAEDIENDFYVDSSGATVEQGFIPRPTNQTISFGMFFQDYLPGNKNFKMHLNFLFGSSLPFGPPNAVKTRNAFRMPPYRRVDIGFSALLIDNKRELPPKNPFRHFESIWISLEVFNLLQISNTVSYLWVKDINSVMYAVPNHLTSRRINARLIVKF